MRSLLVVMITITGLVSSGSFGVARRRANADNPGPAAHVVKLTAKRFAFEPSSITVKKGEPVVLEITSSDVPHGFALPDFNVQAEVKPGKTSRVSFTPGKVGDFTFACNIFCGSGHEEMSGTLKVTE